MKKLSVFRIQNRLLLKNLAFVYWHIGGIVLWLQGAIVACGIAIAFIDGKPVWDTLYLAFITALTIGYGDMTPETAFAKVIAIVIGFLGIIFTGIVVAASLRALEMTIEDQTVRGETEGENLDQAS